MTDLAELELRISSLEADVAAKRLRGLQQASGRAERGITTLNRASIAMDRALGRAVRTASLLTSAITGVTAAGAAFKSLNLAGVAEQTVIGFEVLTGSAEDALRLFREIQDFAAKTPFRFQGLADTTRLLASLGFEAREAFEITKLLAGQIALTGREPHRINQLALAIGQIQAKGKLAGGEVRQLTEALVPVAAILSRKLGISTGEVFDRIEKGAISAQVAIGAILDEIGKKAPTALARQSQTILGLFSTLRDNVEFALRDIGQILAEELDVKGFLRDAIGFARDFAREFGPTLKDIIEAVRALGPALGIAADFAGLLVKQFLFLKGLELAVRLKKWVVGLGGVTSAFRALAAVMRAHPILAFATVLGTGVIAWRHYLQATRDVHPAITAFARNTEETKRGLERMNEVLDVTATRTEEARQRLVKARAAFEDLGLVSTTFLEPKVAEQLAQRLREVIASYKSAREAAKASVSAQKQQVAELSEELEKLNKVQVGAATGIGLRGLLNLNKRKAEIQELLKLAKEGSQFGEAQIQGIGNIIAAETLRLNFLERLTKAFTKATAETKEQTVAVDGLTQSLKAEARALQEEIESIGKTEEQMELLRQTKLALQAQDLLNAKTAQGQAKLTDQQRASIIELLESLAKLIEQRNAAKKAADDQADADKKSEDASKRLTRQLERQAQALKALREQARIGGISAGFSPRTRERIQAREELGPEGERRVAALQRIERVNQLSDDLFGTWESGLTDTTRAILSGQEELAEALRTIWRDLATEIGTRIIQEALITPITDSIQDAVAPVLKSLFGVGKDAAKGITDASTGELMLQAAAQQQAAAGVQESAALTMQTAVLQFEALSATKAPIEAGGAVAAQAGASAVTELASETPAAVTAPAFASMAASLPVVAPALASMAIPLPTIAASFTGMGITAPGLATGFQAMLAPATLLATTGLPALSAAVAAAVIKITAATAILGGVEKGGIFGAARGAGFDRDEAVPFARGAGLGGRSGKVLRAPEYFRFGAGDRLLGVAGEAGPEAVVPLKLSEEGGVGVRGFDESGVLRDVLKLRRGTDGVLGVSLARRIGRETDEARGRVVQKARERARLLEQRVASAEPFAAGERFIGPSGKIHRPPEVTIERFVSFLEEIEKARLRGEIPGGALSGGSAPVPITSSRVPTANPRDAVLRSLGRTPAGGPPPISILGVPFPVAESSPFRLQNRRVGLAGAIPAAIAAAPFRTAPSGPFGITATPVPTRPLPITAVPVPPGPPQVPPVTSIPLPPVFRSPPTVTGTPVTPSPGPAPQFPPVTSIPVSSAPPPPIGIRTGQFRSQPYRGPEPGGFRESPAPVIGGAAPGRGIGVGGSVPGQPLTPLPGLGGGVQPGEPLQPQPGLTGSLGRDILGLEPRSPIGDRLSVLPRGVPGEALRGITETLRQAVPAAPGITRLAASPAAPGRLTPLLRDISGLATSRPGLAGTTGGTSFLSDLRAVVERLADQLGQLSGGSAELRALGVPIAGGFPGGGTAGAVLAKGGAFGLREIVPSALGNVFQQGDVLGAFGSAFGIRRGKGFSFGEERPEAVLPLYRDMASGELGVRTSKQGAKEEMPQVVNYWRIDARGATTESVRGFRRTGRQITRDFERSLKNRGKR